MRRQCDTLRIKILYDALKAQQSVRIARSTIAVIRNLLMDAGIPKEKRNPKQCCSHYFLKLIPLQNSKYSLK